VQEQNRLIIRINRILSHFHRVYVTVYVAVSITETVPSPFATSTLVPSWVTEDHSPEIKSICQIPIAYDKDAKCPKINDFLRSVVAEPDINLLCETAGYCLTTDCSQQKTFMLYGIGSNGKSVFLALLESLVGEDNISAENLQRLESDKYRTAKLYCKRVNICGDIPDTKMNKSEIFKKLTSGMDLIDAENKYQDPFKFHNTAKLVFSANVLPEGTQDKAFYRRWVLINFPNNFEGENADKSLITKLQTPEELSGFLNLALDGLKRVRENETFSNEKSIEATQKEYEFNSNPIAAFMDECTQISDEDCDATILYLEYVDLCKSCRKQHMKNIGFSRKLISMGYTSHRENVQDWHSAKKITMWGNLKIKPDRIGKDKTGYKNAKNLSYHSLLDIEKTEVGQDVNPFVTNNDSFPAPIYQDI
jgi:putative DNA primase/helicase